MKIVSGSGILNPDIAIVGEAAGAEEELQGKPFVGASGKLLDQIFQELGIIREGLYITNVIKFRPEGNRTPTDKEIVEYREWLMAELCTVKPTVVVCLGAVATKAITNDLGLKISKIRGIATDIGEYFDIIPTYHPAYCLRYPDAREILKQDFMKALEYVSAYKQFLIRGES